MNSVFCCRFPAGFATVFGDGRTEHAVHTRQIVFAAADDPYPSGIPADPHRNFPAFRRVRRHRYGTPGTDIERFSAAEFCICARGTSAR